MSNFTLLRPTPPIETIPENFRAHIEREYKAGKNGAKGVLTYNQAQINKVKALVEANKAFLGEKPYDKANLRQLERIYDHPELKIEGITIPNFVSFEGVPDTPPAKPKRNVSFDVPDDKKARRWPWALAAALVVGLAAGGLYKFKPEIFAKLAVFKRAA